MTIFIEELNPEVIHRQLGQNVYSSKGSLLLRKGAIISPGHYFHLKEIGYKSIYLQHDDSNNIEPDSLIISENLRARGPATLRKIFKQLLSDKREEMAQGKKELTVLAEILLKEVNFKLRGGVKILDLKRLEDYLYQHSINVAAYSVLIGYSLQYHQLKLLDLTLSALLHDFGMVFMDDAILNKSTSLQDGEYELVKEHTIRGFQHLNRHCQFEALITIVALQHHERFDGSGFPNGIAGKQIHEYSRIVALANFFDSYTSDRPYRRLHSIEEAVEYIKAEQGKAFDPLIVQHFLKYFQ